MKKNIYLSICIAVVMLCTNITAQCVWSSVGTGTASTGTITTAYNDIAMSPADVPYVSHTEAGVLTVRTFSTGAWTTLGSLSTYTNTAYTSIAFNGAVPYVAFSDGLASGKATVKMYSGGSWVNVGTTVSTGNASFISLAVQSGTPYIAYVDGSAGNKAVVKSYSAGVWTALGAAVSTGSASYTSLSVDNTGTPYIIYNDIANSNFATVKKYNGTSWVAVGTGTVSAGTVTETQIDVSYNNIPYVAFMNNGSYTCYIKAFIAGAWQAVGTGTFSSCYQAIGLAVDPAGTPYVSYYDLGPYKASVRKFDGTAWPYAGNSAFSTGGPAFTSLAITSMGIPYIDYANGSAYVKNLFSPTIITLQPSATAVCAGSGTSISVATNTTGITYQWQVSFGGAFANVVTGATYSGVNTATLLINNTPIGFNGYLYRCVINDGCINIISNNAILTVNPLPVITVNSATVCAGGSKILTAGGAVNYLWNTGLQTATITVTPTATTNYTVTGISATACSANATASVTVISSKTISGNVTSTAGAVSGNMILYKYSPVLSKWDSVAFTPFSSIYSFGLVDSSLYVIKAVPTTTNNVQVTYAANAISWQGATVLSHKCSSNLTQNVAVMPLTSIGTGAGMLSGRITEGVGFGLRPSSPYSPLSPGQPIGGIVIKGGKNPGGNMVVQTTTSANGTYTLSGLPTNSDSYFILVDIPGLDTNRTYHRTLTLTDTQYTGLDFTVDSAKVNPVMPVSVHDLDAIKNQLLMYPNPAKNTFIITYNLEVNAAVAIEMVDLLGNVVKIIAANNRQLAQQHTYTVDISDTKPGIYFIKVNMNGLESTVKLFITD